MFRSSPHTAQRSAPLVIAQSLHLHRRATRFSFITLRLGGIMLYVVAQHPGSSGSKNNRAAALPCERNDAKNYALRATLAIDTAERELTILSMAFLARSSASNPSFSSEFVDERTT